MRMTIGLGGSSISGRSLAAIGRCHLYQYALESEQRILESCNATCPETKQTHNKDQNKITIQETPTEGHKLNCMLSLNVRYSYAAA